MPPKKLNKNIEEITLDLTWQLRWWQKEFFQNYKKYNVLVIHRRWWKTVVAILFLLYRALQEEWTYGYVAPFRSQAKSIAWEILTKFANQIPWIEKNISELFIKLPNWSKISLFWADNQDALRWLDLKWVVLDEYAQMSPNVYSEILFPMLNAHENSFTVWIWTPKWKNSFYELYKKAKDDYYRYYTMYMDVYKTWLLSTKQLNEAKRTMDEDSFKQEYLLDWNVAIKWSYYWKEIDRLNNEWRIIYDLYDDKYPVYTAWDLWIDDNTVILFFQYIEWRIRIIEYFANNWEWLPFYKTILDSKEYVYAMHFLPHDVSVTEYSTWWSRGETFYRMFWADKIQVLKRHSVEDWINMVRELFPRMLFDKSTIEYLNKISEYRPKYNEKTWEYWKPIHCDYSDALRYAATAYVYYVQDYVDYDNFYVDYNNII